LTESGIPGTYNLVLKIFTYNIIEIRLERRGQLGELNGKVAVVTGAGRLRGIGRATAVALAGLGADVVVTGTGRNPSTFPSGEIEAEWTDIDGTSEQVRAAGCKALPLVVDVTNPEHIEMMARRTIEEFGRIDILVNNAAYAMAPPMGPILDVKLEYFQRCVDVKVTGTFLCTQAVLRQMLGQGQGGKIVNISSVAGKSGSIHTLAYNAANFAVVGMTQSMAKELGPKGIINVNCVCPGAVDTSRSDFRGRGKDWQERADNTPIGRHGTDKEVGDFVAYLCTEAASWIHGQSININGGTVMEH
jgi:3-oxoacyl-[acyl-carrier protein] reductase/meso-butanediol dehydrogenase/(S,S)-butanediol dehydrogenase/diacetyl reductase